MSKNIPRVISLIYLILGLAILLSYGLAKIVPAAEALIGDIFFPLSVLYVPFTLLIIIIDGISLVRKNESKIVRGSLVVAIIILVAVLILPIILGNSLS